jgi:hypothetical protein
MRVHKGAGRHTVLQEGTRCCRRAQDVRGTTRVQETTHGCRRAHDVAGGHTQGYRKAHDIAARVQEGTGVRMALNVIKNMLNNAED